MSILRERGKEKIRFRIMDRRVTSKDFKYLKRLFLECLRENPDVTEELDTNYKLIQVYFFYESTDPEVENALRIILDDQTIKYDRAPIPAFTKSQKNIGCIIVFVKHINESTQERKDIANIEKYHKNGIFEELCHLVEQKGDSSIHPSTYGALCRLYRTRNQQNLGSEIVSRLDTDRNHYEVYSMMVRAYPNDWVERYWRYFMKETPETYKQKYEQWKLTIPIKVAYARLVTDTLRRINTLYVAERVPRDKLDNRNKELLDTLINTGKNDVEQLRYLIERDMGFGASNLIDSTDESMFKSPEIFFSIILDLWKTLSL